MKQFFAQNGMTIAAILLSFIGSIVVTLLPIWLVRPRQGIRWIALTPKHMMDIAEEVSDRLSVTFSGKKVTNLTKYTFILHNYGREPIDGEAIVEPLTWKGSGEILDARVLVSDPFVELQLDRSKRSLEIRWKLFNQSSQALIEIISDEESVTDVGDISAQIRGVPKINIRSLRYADEEDIRRRVRRTTPQLPKILQYMQSESITVFLFHHSTQIFAIYFLVSIVMAFFYVSDNWFGFDTITSIFIGVALAVSFSTLLLFFLRNPYVKLLKKRRNSDR